VTGGHEPDSRGFFLEPTVVAGLEQNDEMTQREIFRPVLTVPQFSDEPEAVATQHGAEPAAAAPKKRTRRGSRGGRGRKKKAPAAEGSAPESSAETAETETAEAEPASGQNGAGEWEYVPMSEWESDLRPGGDRS